LPDTFSAFIFPAFAHDYSEHPVTGHAEFMKYFASFLASGASQVDPVLADFDFERNNFLDDELRTQYITYIFSCAASAVLRKSHFVPVTTAGFSMGIYAALFDAGAISFGTGLDLIRLAFHCLKDTLKGARFGMGTIIGLGREDIEQLISRPGLRIEITNRSAPYSFVVSGADDDIVRILESARLEGALHTRDLGVSLPYHSGYLLQGSLEFEKMISGLEFGPPANPIQSLIDQAILDTGESLRKEVVRNLHHPMHWLETQRRMSEEGVSLFIECGPSSGLVKNARFIDGDYRFRSFGSPDLM